MIAALKLKLAPYALALKIGLLAVAFLVGLRAGCSLQADRDEAKMARKDAALVQASARLDAAAGALRAVNAHTAAEVAKAQANAADRAEEAAKASARADAYRDLLVEIERDVEQAKATSPACRAKLEEKPCATLR